MQPRSPNQSLMPCESQSSSTIQQRPSLETTLQTAQTTQQAIDRLLKSRSNPSSLAPEPPSIFGSREKAIKVISRPTDPLQPPKFKVKKVQKPIAEAPAPVMHSPPRSNRLALDKEQRKAQSAAWKIPPAISNWKNPKGFTISLDKRTMRDSQTDRPLAVSDSFGKMAEALAVAEQQARQELEMRSALMRRQAAEEREAKEQQLREMAQRARESLAFSNSSSSRSQSSIKAGLFMQRRQISSIELGEKNSAVSVDSLHDKRVYGRDAGIESGFVDDEDYSLYDRPLFSENASKRSRNVFIYTGNAVFGGGGAAVEEHHDSIDDGTLNSKIMHPIQFERHDDDSGKEASNGKLNGKDDASLKIKYSSSSSHNTKDDDPFGVESFLTQARNRSKRQ